jgi:excisionase family DNA binding protein
MMSVNRKKEISYAEIARSLGISRERVRQIAIRQRLNKGLVQGAGYKVNQIASPMTVMLTTREVAQILNIHINTVRRWSNQGILRAYRVGSRGDRRFMRNDIVSFLAKNSEASHD